MSKKKRKKVALYEVKSTSKKKKKQKSFKEIVFEKDLQPITLNKKEKQNFLQRGVLLLVIFVIGLSLLLVKVVEIKLVHGKDYEKRVLSKVAGKESKIVPQRGMILDRNEKILATSTLIYNIILDPFALMSVSEERREKVYKILSDYTQKPFSEIKDLVENNPDSRYEIYFKGVSAEDMMMLKEKGLYGVVFEEDFKRLYPKGNFASQLLGFFSKERVGQYGVEQEYESYLKGVPGRIYPKLQESDVLTTEVIPAKNGSDVILTVDETIQKYTEEVMYKYIEQEKPINAAALFMNPHTGEIYSMFSYPSFDPNIYNDLSSVIGKENWEKLGLEKRSELLNRSWKSYNMQAPYEPGSTFKPIYVAALVDRGIVSPNSTFNCPGYRVVAGRTIRCHKRGGHGQQTLEQALANSCNVAMMDMGAMIPSSEFEKILFEFGFGQLTGLDIFGEVKGILHPEGKMGPVEVATSSFGQSFTVTSIQLLNAFAALVNGGNLMEPYLVSHIVSEDGSIEYEHEPVVKRRVLSEEAANTVRDMLDSVILEGTGSTAEMEEYTVGGKTGTAEKLPRGSGKHILSFVGFAPLQNPEVIGIVVFDEIRQYGGVAGSAFKEIMEKTLPYLEVRPDKVIEDGEVKKPVDTLTLVPDLTQLTLNEAIKKLIDLGFDYEIMGVGSTITNQFPKANVSLTKDSVVKIYVESDAPEKVQKVPDLIGMTWKDASEFVKGHFILKGNPTDDVIKEQIPKAGTKVDQNSEIFVAFNSFKEEETTEEEVPAYVPPVLNDPNINHGDLSATDVLMKDILE